jgi:hypothetical protein
MSLDHAAMLVDQLIYDFNGEHLNDLERLIVQGVCEGKKYGDIAEEQGCTNGHVTDTAAKLWQSLSKAVGEKITKTNFKSAIERHHSASNSSQEFVQISTVNVCSDITFNNRPTPKNKEDNSFNDRTSPKYLLDAPALLPFFGRTTELTQLQTWLENHTRLILIHAPSGTGKTALAPSPNSSIATSPPTSAAFLPHRSTSPSASAN